MRTHTVLVVEDDLDIRETLMDLLEMQGFQVVGMPHGERALAWLRSGRDRPCIILLDLMMPVMDGTAFRQAQLEDPALADIPVIVLSAFRDLTTAIEPLKARAVLKKPPRMEELMATVLGVCRPQAVEA